MVPKPLIISAYNRKTQQDNQKNHEDMCYKCAAVSFRVKKPNSFIEIKGVYASFSFSHYLKEFVECKIFKFQNYLKHVIRIDTELSSLVQLIIQKAYLEVLKNINRHKTTHNLSKIKNYIEGRWFSFYKPKHPLTHLGLNI